MLAMEEERRSLAQSGRIPYRVFLKVLLDFQLKGHDKFLSRFRRYLGMLTQIAMVY